jgi:hypothetical protein
MKQYLKRQYYRFLLRIPTETLQRFGMNDFRTYMTWTFKAGYVAQDGHPMVCQWCHSKEFEEKNHSRLDSWCLLEYDLYCKKCKKIAGQWAYGNWIP